MNRDLRPIQRAIARLCHNRVSVTGSAMRYIRGQVDHYADIDLIVYEPPFGATVLPGLARPSAFSIQFPEVGVDLHFAGPIAPLSLRYQSNSRMPFAVAYQVHRFIASRCEFDQGSGLLLATVRGLELAWWLFQLLRFPKFDAYPHVALADHERRDLLHACPEAEYYLPSPEEQETRTD